MNTQHTPKNNTHNKTNSWTKERQRLTDFYHSTPFYGSSLSEKLFNNIKKVIPSVIQASICGCNGVVSKVSHTTLLLITLF